MCCTKRFRRRFCFVRLISAQWTGQAKITILIGFALVAVASGLLTLINQSSSIAQLVGFEAIAGIGYGSVLNIGASHSLTHD